jgi:hypothetical protein
VERRVRRLKLNQSKEQAVQEVKDFMEANSNMPAIFGSDDSDTDDSADSLTLTTKNKARSKPKAKPKTPASAQTDKQLPSLASLFSPTSSEEKDSQLDLAATARSPDSDDSPNVSSPIKRKPVVKVKEGKLIKKAKLSLESALTNRESDDDDDMMIFDDNRSKNMIEDHPSAGAPTSFARRLATMIDSDED